MQVAEGCISTTCTSETDAEQSESTRTHLLCLFDRSRRPLLPNNHIPRFSLLSQALVLESQLLRDEVHGTTLVRRERARETEFVAERVGGEEEDARVEFEGLRVVHVELYRGGSVSPAV